MWEKHALLLRFGEGDWLRSGVVLCVRRELWYGPGDEQLGVEMFLFCLLLVFWMIGNARWRRCLR